jgi:hypothetical protein
MGELGQVRAEKQALEQQISDLFALKAKHAPGSSRKNVRPPTCSMCDGMLMVDSERTCTASGAAGDAWADADAGLAGGTESNAPASSPMTRCFGKWNINS